MAKLDCVAHLDCDAGAGKKSWKERIGITGFETLYSCCQGWLVPKDIALNTEKSLIISYNSS